LKKRNICCWDLEGPISIIDFAAELCEVLDKKIKNENPKRNIEFLFSMISSYDDYLIDTPGIKKKLSILDYQPGDTLRLIAPLYISYFSNTELTHLANQNSGLLLGCQDLMLKLQHSWDIYIISTSYEQFAYSFSKVLNVAKDHIYCTSLNIDELKNNMASIKDEMDILIDDIFYLYLKHKNDLSFVIDDLNSFFWNKENNNYLKIMDQIKVRGGKRKEKAIEEISELNRVDISELIAIGDSITDINMLQRVRDEGGIAISFNGSRFSVKKANIAITSISNLGVLPIFESKDTFQNILDVWENMYDIFKNNPKYIPDELISKSTKNLFILYNIVPEIDYLTNKNSVEIEKIIKKQEDMRRFVRGKAGKLN